MGGGGTHPKEGANQTTNILCGNCDMPPHVVNLPMTLTTRHFWLEISWTLLWEEAPEKVEKRQFPQRSKKFSFHPPKKREETWVDYQRRPWRRKSKVVVVLPPPPTPCPLSPSIIQDWRGILGKWKILRQFFFCPNLVLVKVVFSKFLDPPQTNSQ